MGQLRTTFDDADYRELLRLIRAEARRRGLDPRLHPDDLEEQIRVTPKLRQLDRLFRRVAAQRMDAAEHRNATS